MGSPAYDERWGDEEDEQDELVPAGPAYGEDWGAEPETFTEDPEHNDMTVGDVEMGAPPTDTNDDQHGYMKRLIAYGNGLVGNWGGEIANAAVRGADALSPEGLSGVGDGDPEVAEGLVDQAAQEHPYYGAAGNATSAIAAGAAAGPGALAQGLTQAGVHGASEYGASHDPGRAAAAAGVGGVVGAGAAALGGGIARIAGKSPAPAAGGRPVAPTMQLGEEAAMAPRPYARGGDPQTMQTYMGPAPAPHPAPMPPQPPAPPDMMGQLAGLVGRSPKAQALKAGGQMLGRAMDSSRVPNAAAGAATVGTAQAAGAGIEALWKDSTHRVAADKSVVNWALKQTLSDAQSAGLSDKDTQALMEAVSSGDKYKTHTLLWTIQQKNPLFAKKYTEALQRANGDRE